MATAPPASQGKLPKVHIGPILELLKTSTARDRVKTVADSKGQVHVLVASTEFKQVVDVVVRSDGVAERQVIGSHLSPSTLDGAFDKQGRLHVLIDREHMLLEKEGWRTSARTPWQKAGLEARSPRFVRGAPDLVWAFLVAGKDVAAPGRWEWYGFGGYGGGIIWPWYTRGTREVLVAESDADYGYWNVLDPQVQEDTIAADLASDSQGNVRVLYERAQGGLAGQRAFHYASVSAQDLNPVDADRSDALQSRNESRHLRAVTGKLVQDNRLPARLAVDPETGTALVGMRWLVQGDTWTDAINVYPSLRVFGAHLAPAGNDSFHMIVVNEARDRFWGKGFPIAYMMFSEGEWSAPLELGLADTASFWGFIWDAVSITSVGKGRAFAVWPMEHGIVGRWIECIQ